MNDWIYRIAGDHGLRHGERMTSPMRESGLVQWCLHLATWELFRVYLILHQRLRVRGGENLPTEPPLVLVSNHSSHLDAMVLGAVLDWQLRGNVSPLAAGDTFFKTGAGSTLSALALNALPLWRGHCGIHRVQRMRTRLVEQGGCFILFPEGSRSRDGRMGRFRAGVGMLVAGTRVPVIPCHLSGTFDSWPPGHKHPRAGRVELRVGEALDFEEVENGRKGWQRVARELEEKVRELGEDSREVNPSGEPGLLPVC